MAFKRCSHQWVVGSTHLYGIGRICISWTAREESAAVIRRFNALYPHIQAYRSFASPNFKVTVGNFRTRLEAEALLQRLKGDFPDAFIVRERFKYPSIGRADTRPAEFPVEL